MKFPQPLAASPRAAANRANAQHSTGPTSAPGKIRSSQNSFRHGLYSTALIVPGEDDQEFDRLRASLRLEHRPANTTEEILVDELAQHFWRLRRYRELEARSWDPDNLDGWTRSGLFDRVARAMHAAERSFHRALTALVALQKQRGFVPSATADGRSPQPHSSKPAAGHAFEIPPADGHAGFVPQLPLEVPVCGVESGAPK